MDNVSSYRPAASSIFFNLSVFLSSAPTIWLSDKLQSALQFVAVGLFNIHHRPKHFHSLGRDHFSDQHNMDAQTARPFDGSAASTSAVNGVAEQPWYAAYPEARSTPSPITRQELLQLLKSDSSPGESFVLVDLRRTDYEVHK